MSGRRVGLLCGYLEPTRDGVADYTRRLAVHLRLTGLEPLVITTHAAAQTAGRGAVGVTERWDVRRVAAAARALRRLDLDLVHVQFAPSVFGFSRAVGLLPLFLHRQIPLIVTLHEYGVWTPRGPGRRVRSGLWSAAERRGYADRETLLLASRAACLLVPSAEQLDVLRARFHRHAPVTLEMPIGSNVEVAMGDQTEARAAVRLELGAAPDAPLVVFFGFLHPDKDLDQLIASVAAIRAQRPGVQLLLIGGAESHSVPSTAANRLRRELERVAAACGVQDDVHFTGYLPDAEVSRLLQAADAAAFPFKAGVTRKSSSLLAALAAGVPVVATAPPGEVDGPSEADGVLRVPPSDTAALTDALERVLSDGVLVGRLTAAARMLAVRHSWDAIATAHAKVYAWALASAQGRESWTLATKTSRVARPRREGEADVIA
jgi:glycosyltransferase involved in cell wall biosynthesis